MVSIWESPFLVVDVETNGSDPLKNRITEIACLKVQGGEIIEEYSSLVNPHQFIPPFISQMTGITNEMAFKAPEAKVVVPHLKRLMPDDKTIFVAHNVKFDWSFVRHTFMRENESLDELNQLCTYKLARKLLPNDMKKNVGALATFFNINMKNRHRAFDDAKATALILLELLEIAESEHGINSLHELLSFQNKRNNVYKFSKPNYNFRYFSI
ncbi:MAG: PolC-type DNA polymerase III [Candidatus Kapaibacteriota bacterium]